MIYDISVAGCMIESRALTVNVGDLVVIRPEGMEGLAGKVQWTEDHRAGISFEQALYLPVAEYLQRKYRTYLSSLEMPAQPEGRRAA